MKTSANIRLHILADLHLEFGLLDIPTTDSDAVVLAGDVHVGAKGIEWIKPQFPNRPVIYVAGNHEYYRHALPKLTDTLRQQTAGSHIHFLENQAIELNGFTILGCTLWSDFALLGNPSAAMAAAEAQMNDFRLIRHSEKKRALRATDMAELFRESVAWLFRKPSHGTDD